MKKALLVVVLAAFATVSAVFAQDQAEKKADFKTSTIYVCDKCQKAALKAGKCCEDQDMAAKNVVATKNVGVFCCDCAAGCKCTLKEGDATKCSCDKDVKRIYPMGMYVCDKCNVISDQKGKCPGCGGDPKFAPAPSGRKDAAPAGEAKAPAPSGETEAVPAGETKAPASSASPAE